MKPYSFDDLIDSSVSLGLENLKGLLKDITEQLNKIKDTKVDLGGGSSGKDLSKLEAEQRKLNEEIENGILLQKEQLKVESKIASETAKLNSTYAEKQAELKKVRSEQRKMISEVDVADDSYRKLSNRLNELKNEYRQVSAEQRKKLIPEIQKLDKEVKKLDADIGNFQRNVGNYPKAGLDGIKGLAAMFGAGLGLSELNQMMKETTKLQSKLTNLFGVQGTELDRLTSQFLSLTKVYDDISTEQLGIATNALQKSYESMGVTAGDALNSIEKGLQIVKTDQGEFLDIIREYPDFLREAGVSMDEFVAITAQQINSGVFSDKGIDSLKEFGLTLGSTLTPAAKDALNQIGIASDQLQQRIESGQITMFDAMQEVSKKLNEFPPQSKAVGDVMANVFRGAGEDSKRFVLNLANVSTDLNSIAVTTTEYERSNIRLAKAQSDLQVAFTKSDTALGNLSNNLRNAVSWVLEFVSGSQKESEALVDERIEMNALVMALEGANGQKDLQAKLFDEINSKYPELLANQTKENINYDLLYKNLALANDQFERKIRLAINQEKITELQIEQNEAFDKSLLYLKEFEKSFEMLYGTRFASLSLEEKFNKVRSDGDLAANVTMTLYQDKLKEYQNISMEINDLLNQRNSLEREAATLVGSAGNIASRTGSVISSMINNEVDLAKKRKTEQESQRQKAAELLREREAELDRLEQIEINKAKINDASQTEIFDIQNKYNEKRLELYKRDELNFTNVQLKIKEINQQIIAERFSELDKIRDIEIEKANVMGETSDQILNREIEFVKQKLMIVEKGSLDELKLLSNLQNYTNQLSDNRLSLLDTQAQNEATLLKSNYENKIIDESDYAKKSAEIQLKLAHDKLAIIKQLALADNVLTDTEIENITEYERIISGLMSDIENMTRETEESDTSIAGRIQSLLGLSDEDFVKLQDSAMAVLDFTKQMYNDLLSVKEESIQKEIDLRNKNIESLNSELDNEIQINKERQQNGDAYDTKREQQLKEQIKQENELKEKAVAEQEKVQKQRERIETAQQISSLITAVSDVIKGFAVIPVVGSILGPIAAAAMIASYGALKIQARKAEHGAIVTLDGKRHSEGGVNLGESGIEAEKGETMVIYPRGTSRAKQKDIKDFYEAAKSDKLNEFYLSKSDSLDKMNYQTAVFKQFVSVDNNTDKDLLNESKRHSKLLKENNENTKQILHGYRHVKDNVFVDSSGNSIIYS